MHSWEPTECYIKGIQILTIKLLLVISIVFIFFGTPCKLISRGSDLTSTTATINGLLTNQMRLVYPINQSNAYYKPVRPLIPQGPTQQKPWRPCWCSRQ
jgi:hypothetical protein